MLTLISDNLNFGLAFMVLYFKKPKSIFLKSCIGETPDLSMCADKSKDTVTFKKCIRCQVSFIRCPVTHVMFHISCVMCLVSYLACHATSHRQRPSFCKLAHYAQQDGSQRQKKIFLSAEHFKTISKPNLSILRLQSFYYVFFTVCFVIYNVFLLPLYIGVNIHHMVRRTDIVTYKLNQPRS